MSMKKLTLFAAVLLTCLLGTLAHAEENGKTQAGVTAAADVKRVHLRLKGGLAVGGSLESVTRVVATEGGGSASDPVKDPLIPVFGGGLQVDVETMEYLSIGAALAFSSWTTELSDKLELGRNSWIDADLTLRGQLGFFDGAFDGYLQVPFGLTINRFSEESNLSSGTRWGHGLGWNIGALAGVEVPINKDGGAFVELGWKRRDFVHTSQGAFFGTPAELELEATSDQFVANVGLSFSM